MIRASFPALPTCATLAARGGRAAPAAGPKSVHYASDRSGAGNHRRNRNSRSRGPGAAPALAGDAARLTRGARQHPGGLGGTAWREPQDGAAVGERRAGGRPRRGGRERELAAVRRVQAGTRLLTLTGPGGGGKTRLALALAGELLWAYPHGVWFVDLAPLADPALVPQVVAAALGLRPTGQQPLAETLIEALKARHLLLMLDNCEHLLP